MKSPTAVRDEPLYGWVMVLLAPLYLGFAIGSLGAVAVFLKPLGAEFGWLRGATAFSYLVGNLGAGLGGILMGYLADRYTSRRIVLFGSVVIGLSYLAMARQTTLWEFYLYSSLASGLGAASFFAPLLANVGGWFTRNKGLALGIATAGQALGQGLVPYGAGLLIAGLGWRDAYNALGLLALCVLLPLGLLVRDPPTHARSATAASRAAAQPIKVFPIPPVRAVSLVSLAAIFCCITMSTPLVHAVALATDRGVEPVAAAGVLLAIMISGALGRISFGKLSDQIGGLRAYLIASLWQTSLVLWFLNMESALGFYILAVVFGFGYAGVMTCLIVCAQDFAPLARSGVATAVVSLFGFIGMGIGGFQGGFFFDLTGDYFQSFANAAIAGTINLLIVASLYLYRQRGSDALAAQAGAA